MLPSLDKLSLEAQVAQMVVVRASGHLFDHEIEYPQWEASRSQLRYLLEDLGVGGVILLGGSAAEVAARSRFLQSLANIPLLIAADIEEGVGQRFSGATWFPPPMALGAIARNDLPLALELAEQMGRTTAQEAAALGLNWVLAPVVDVNNNPANPVINVRAFGEAPETVGQLATAFICGAQAFPVLTTAKHFPGHGDTATDSHLTLPVVDHDRTRLEQVELAPFKRAIAAGVDSIMTAHIGLTALDSKHPATFSRPVLTGLLRRDLGFDGLVVTDALVMGAIAQRYGASEAAVLAVAAGADVVLMPADPKTAIAAICDAVRAGRLSRDQIRAAVGRLWQAKQKVMGEAISQRTPHAWEQPPILPLDQVAQPSCRRAAVQILSSSLRAEQVPLVPSATPGRNLILVDDVLACRFLPRTAPAVLLPQQQSYELTLVDDRWPVDTVINPQAAPQPTVLQLFIRGNPFRSSAGLIALARDYGRSLGSSLQAVVVYGSPYVLAALELSPAVPYVFCYGQMPEAQAIALSVLFGRESASESGQAVDGRFTD